jgi:hypothetical protein
MKGFHYLMRQAVMMNAIALHTSPVASPVCTMGIKLIDAFVRETGANPWLKT